jgi:cytochrome c oxidase subunit 1
MLIFSRGMHWIGLLGAPRRTMIGVALGNYGSGDWRVPTLFVGIGGLILFLSGILFFTQMIMTTFFAKEKAQVEMPVAEAAQAEPIPAWLNNWQPWLVATVVLIIVAYAPVLIQLISQGQFTSPGFQVW